MAGPLSSSTIVHFARLSQPVQSFSQHMSDKHNGILITRIEYLTMVHHVPKRGWSDARAVDRSCHGSKRRSKVKDICPGH